MKRKEPRGETIVEVIIGIAVVASVMAGAYYLLNRSYRQGQSAVERVAALKATESKIELLRTTSKDVLNAMVNDKQFCISSSGIIDVTTVKTSACFVDGKYSVVIKKLIGANVTYRAYTEWDGLIVNKESLIIYFRP